MYLVNIYSIQNHSNNTQGHLFLYRVRYSEQGGLAKSIHKRTLSTDTSAHINAELYACMTV